MSTDPSTTAIESQDIQTEDIAPGDETLDGSGVAQGLLGYVIGLVLAFGLSAAAFVLPMTGLVFTPALPTALVVMAIAQMGVHIVFFLHITTGRDSTNNVLALAFGLLIVSLVLIGSLWIMANLNRNMMPMTEVMRMQR